MGSSVARILLESKPDGLELTHIYNRNVARKKADWVPKSVVWSEDWESVLASDVDVIVELVGGLDPAGTWARRAIEAGKSVVTANKKLIAYHGVELERLAAARGRTSEVRRRGGGRYSGDSGSRTGAGRRPHRAYARDS